MDDSTVTNTNPAPCVDEQAAPPLTPLDQELLTIGDRLCVLERQVSSLSGMDGNAVLQLSAMYHRDQTQRWQETYNAYLPMAHQLACTTEDKVPRIMSLTHQYAMMYANLAHDGIERQDAEVSR